MSRTKKNGTALDHLDAARQHLNGDAEQSDIGQEVADHLGEQMKAVAPDSGKAFPKPNTQAAAGVAAKTLTGDIRDFILDRLRYEQDKRPWNKRSETEQRETIAKVEEAVHASVEKAVQIIAAAGMQTIQATLDSVTVKDGIKAVFTLAKHDPLRHQLVDAQGSVVMIVVANPDEFEGERAPAEVIPDQAPLPIDEATGVQHSGADDNNSADHLFN